jgi:hypothetical protein
MLPLTQIKDQEKKKTEKGLKKSEGKEEQLRTE